MGQKAKLILATDLSDNARPAAEWAHGFGRTEGAEVAVVHVVEISAAHWAAGAYDFLDDAGLREQAEERVRKWYVDATGSEPASVQVRCGTPAVQLAEAVREEKADLLVISRSGKGGWEKFWVGSTARALAMEPPCEVVMVHPEHSRPEVAEVLVGMDFSENAERALATACRLARRYGAHLQIIHSEEVDDIDVLDGIGAATIPAKYRRSGIDEEVSKRMKSMEEAHASDLEGIDYDTRFMQDNPARALIERCDKDRADVLVIGRTGHSPLLANVLGSVVNRVVQAAPTTVVIVPAG